MIQFLLFLFLSISFICFTFFFGAKPYIFLYLTFRDLLKKIKYNIKHKEEKKFNKYGFHIYCGLGGKGKTLSIVKQLEEYREQYPKLWIVTNFKCQLADQHLNSWEDLVNIENPNGIEYGVVFAFDEIHLTLNSDSFKSRPDDLLEYISQQRKLRKQILASAQVFNRVDKVLREQTNLVIECNNLFGRWVFNKAFLTEEYLLNAELKDNGIRKRQRAWRKNFIATDSLYKLYDTHEVMKPLFKNKSKSEILQTRMINEITKKIQYTR